MPDHKTLKFEANGVSYRMHPNEAVELGIQALSAAYPALGFLLTAARDGELLRITHSHRHGISNFYAVRPEGTDRLAEVLMAFDPNQFELDLESEFIDVESPTLSMFTAMDLSDIEIPAEPPPPKKKEVAPSKEYKPEDFL